METWPNWFHWNVLQFAGGFDPESMSAFEALRACAHVHTGNNQEAMAAANDWSLKYCNLPKHAVFLPSCHRSYISQVFLPMIFLQESFVFKWEI